MSVFDLGRRPIYPAGCFLNLKFTFGWNLAPRRCPNKARKPSQGKGPGGLLHGHLDAGRRRDRVERRSPHLQLWPKVLRHPCAQVSGGKQQYHDYVANDSAPIWHEFWKQNNTKWPTIIASENVIFLSSYKEIGMERDNSYPWHLQVSAPVQSCLVEHWKESINGGGAKNVDNARRIYRRGVLGGISTQSLH